MRHPGGAEVLVRIANTLIDLDERLGLRVVLPPVGAHAGAAGVRGADAAQFVEVLVEHRGVEVAAVHVGHHVAIVHETGEGPDAPIGEHHVAVAAGVADAALIGEHRDERRRVVVQVGGLLDEPPGVLLAAAVVVVAVADPVEPAGVERVPPHVLEHPVVAAVLADLGMAVELALEKLVGLASRIDPVPPHAGDVLGFVRVRRRGPSVSISTGRRARPRADR